MFAWGFLSFDSLFIIVGRERVERNEQLFWKRGTRDTSFLLLLLLLSFGVMVALVWEKNEEKLKEIGSKKHTL